MIGYRGTPVCRKKTIGDGLAATLVERLAGAGARWTCFERKILMLIRITYRDKCLDGQKIIGETDFIVPLAGSPK